MKQKRKNTLKIGLTGGIGAGKTTVSNIFKSFGTPVFNSDNVSKKLLNNNEIIIQNIMKSFGESIVYNNRIDTNSLAKIVFSSKQKLSVLNSIIHPHVSEKFSHKYNKITI